MKRAFPPHDPGNTNGSPSVSLIIAVYNRADALRLVLAACARQSFADFEVLLADDGSGPSVREVFEEACTKFSYPITHLWQEDRGWRKNAALNNAIRVARGSHLVFIDGDCIPSLHFLVDHNRERVPGKILLGRRVETSERWSRERTPENIASGEFERIGWREILDGIKGDALRLEDGIRIQNRYLRAILHRDATSILGSNFSASREDLVAVNGFDEQYDGPGCGEDSDIQFRLSLTGVTAKSLRNLAILYHLYHPHTRVSDASWDRFESVKRAQQPRCRVGLEHLP